MNCPCKGCTKRWVSETSRCHASCTEYKEWAEFTKEKNADIAKRRAAIDSVSGVLIKYRRQR